jgi:hypothetical protein
MHKIRIFRVKPDVASRRRVFFWRINEDFLVHLYIEHEKYL